MQYQSGDLSTFSKQIGFAIKNYSPHGFQAANLNGVIISGLGGSGIAGRIVQGVLQPVANMPVQVVSDYELPAWADEKTLVIASSYSGNTEETLYMFRNAMSKGCPSLVLSTGGELTRIAGDNNVQCYPAETGFQPRMALGYSLTYLVCIFEELLGKKIFKNTGELIKKLADIDRFKSRAGELLGTIEDLNHKFVVISDRTTTAAGIRFCQQIQENAKGEAFVTELPEANHNVIESYYGKMDSSFILLNGNAHERTSLRFKFIKDLLTQNGNKVCEINLDGNNIEELIDRIYVLDWLSLIIADKKGVNSVKIPNINNLKKYLSGN